MVTKISSFEAPQRPDGRGDEPAGPWRRARLAEEVRGQVASTVNAQKNRAAAGVGGVASAIRQAGDELRSHDESLALYVEWAGDRLRQLADRIRNQGAEEMAAEAADFARRRPAVFIGGAFIVGLALARFLKSTASPEIAHAASRRKVALTGTWTPADDFVPATSLEEELARTAGGF